MKRSCQNVPSYKGKFKSYVLLMNAKLNIHLLRTQVNFFFFFPTGVYDQKHWKTTGLMSFFLTDIYILTGLLADNFSTQKTVRLQF